MRALRPGRRAPEPHLRLGPDALVAADVEVTLGGAPVLRGVDVRAGAGEVVALVGPNGAGKSTLLGALAGDLAPSAGTVAIGGRPVDGWDGLELARTRAVLPQQATVTFPFSVREVVEMGRAPWVAHDGDPDGAAVVDAALRATEVGHLATRRVPSLSGGERARVAMARVLAQQTPVVLLDEPTAALDLHHQELVLDLARRRAGAGVAVVVVLHDLGLAAAHADRVVVLRDGLVVADGPPAAVLDAALLSDVYQHALEVVAHPRTGAPLVLPVR
ncbi:heme ABC transporter ATP-binding protein [Iamia majanohamensis]|uniref:Heme ABC transporter ATP-binding protein n=1 Tax=Iamia majanohamensis TaxID=467976 RepID=A0AAF0BWN2_9ACTN|nr:heme ABC transporter ATP-binding protein [Iamia majanohamensis]WCO68258.1 heme ABC transporter ATP-binding protein [Iamia majanohamensis]